MEKSPIFWKIYLIGSKVPISKIAKKCHIVPSYSTGGTSIRGGQLQQDLIQRRLSFSFCES